MSTDIPAPTHDRSRPPPVSANHRTPCESRWLGSPNGLHGSSIRRVSPELADSTSASRQLSSNTAASQLYQDRCVNHHHHWPLHFRYSGIPLHTTGHSKSESVGRCQPDPSVIVHFRPYVQPHSKSTVRCRRRKGWHLVLRGWLSESIWNGNADCGCDV